MQHVKSNNRTHEALRVEALLILAERGVDVEPLASACAAFGAAAFKASAAFAEAWSRAWELRRGTLRRAS